MSIGDPLNDYGDREVYAASGYGVDVASQRFDALDEALFSAVDVLGKTHGGGSVSVLELGCGLGGLTRAVAARGANVCAVDRHDYGPRLLEANTLPLSGDKIRFFSSTLPCFPAELEANQFDYVVSQRTLHYLPFAEAKSVLAWCRRHLRAGGTIFLSVSGIDSELSRGYKGARDPIEKRWAYLGEEMATKHGIRHSVCLYSLSDFQKMLVDSGFIMHKAWVSDFGNIKLIGKSNGK
jgi:SAM-dependent methyltransferase